MDIYVINLAQRQDRMQLIHDQLTSFGLAYTRIEAVNGLGDDDIGYPADHPRLSKGEYACYKSHALAWQKLVDSGAKHCLILEDDTALGADFRRVLDHHAFFDHTHPITRLETRLDAKVTIRRKVLIYHNNFRIHLTHAFEGGSGAYVLKTAFARFLLAEHSKPRIQCDNILLDPRENSFPPYNVAQLVPAVTTQRQYLNDSNASTAGSSDLDGPRRKQPKHTNLFGWAKREIAYPFLNYWPFGENARTRLLIPFKA